MAGYQDHCNPTVRLLQTPWSPLWRLISLRLGGREGQEWQASRGSTFGLYLLKGGPTLLSSS